MKKSTPIPLSASFVAVFFHPGCSVANSFLSFSVPWAFGSSLMTSLPGPQVGKLEMAHTTLPPVDCKADRAALIAGSRAGSGFLILEKSDGICPRRDEMTSLMVLVPAIGQQIRSS